jgi:hypothetical protein
MDIFNSLKTQPFNIQDHNPSLRKYGIGFPHTEETKQQISEMKTGLKQSPEHIQKRVSKVIGFKQSEHQKTIAAETLSTEWFVTNPKGESFKIKNLRKFCRENNLDQGNLSRGSYKGWKATKIET